MIAVASAAITETVDNQPVSPDLASVQCEDVLPKQPGDA